jgi:EmrB/QacA subfamily drug resistance transporter
VESSPTAIRPARRGFAPLPLIVAGALFMETLDGTVVVTALPQIGASFGATPESLGLAVTAYMVTLAAVVPASGWIAERFGARSVFAGAVGLFVFASVLCGLSTGLWMFVASRVLQGFAAALMSPVGRLVVIRTTEKKDLIPAIAAITWPGLIAPVLGPPLGGLIATYASWRWIFFLNVPIGLAGVALALRYTPNHRLARPPRFDTPGFLLTAAALGGLIYGLDLIGQAGADRALAAALVLVAVGLGAAALWHARRTPVPLLDLRPLRWATFRLTSASSGFLARLAISATPFLLPLMFQLGFGFTAFEAGMMVLIYMAGNLAMKTVTTPVLRWFNFRPVLVAANAVTALALLVCGLVGQDTPPPVIWTALFVAGLSRSMTFTAINTLTFADVAPEEKAGATALSAMLNQLSFSLGVAVAALALNLSLAVFREPSLSLWDFRVAFLAMAAVAAVAAAGFLRLHPDAGAEVSGRGARPASAP